MSGMSGNPYQHFEEAAALLADKPGEYEIEKSKALATLALAYEQRTANLMAFYGDGPRVDVGDPAYAELHKQLVERLGLA